VPLTRIVKSIAVFSEKDDGSTTFALLLLRGDHELNEIKASKLAGISPFRFASESEVEEYLGCKPGYIGPAMVDRKKWLFLQIAALPP
jgi:prolyl-tRNA synthetase